MRRSDSGPQDRKPLPRAVACPRCGKEVRWTGDFPFRPFCSERCKLIDLGQWASEQYRIPSEPGREELDRSDENDRR